MPTVGATATISGEGRSTEDRARRLYTEIVADIHAKGIRTRSTSEGVGYLWNGNLSTVASRCWPDLTITPGRTGPASKQFLETIKKHLAANKNVVWVQERGQFYVSPDYKEARVKKKSSPAVVPLPQESLTDQAKRIWTRAIEYCESVKASIETHGQQNIEFYVCDKPLAFFVKAEFPELNLPAMQTEPAFEKYRRPFYDLLRATTNAVNIGAKHLPGLMVEGEHKWLIRKDWHDSHEAFQFVFPTPEIPVAEEPEVPLVVEEVVPEAVNDTTEPPAEVSAAEQMQNALNTFTQMVQAWPDLVTEKEMAEAYAADLKAENDTLKAAASAAVDGSVIVGLIEEVLANVYSGAVGLSRALADIEDIVKQAKED